MNMENASDIDKCIEKFLLNNLDDFEFDLTSAGSIYLVNKKLDIQLHFWIEEMYKIILEAENCQEVFVMIPSESFFLTSPTIVLKLRDKCKEIIKQTVEKEKKRLAPEESSRKEKFIERFIKNTI